MHAGNIKIHTHTHVILALQEIEFYHEIYFIELYRIRFIAVLNLRELVWIIHIPMHFVKYWF